MITKSVALNLYAELASLFEYPNESIRVDVEHVQQALATDYPPAAAELDAFATALQDLPFDKVEEIYTRTFDIAAQCVPYVSVFLFGQESFKRSQLMAGLTEVYERAGVNIGSELPDHIAVILRHAPHFTAEEWEEMAHYCLPAPVAQMIRDLDRGPNPYRHVARALQIIIETDFPAEAPHA